MFAMFHVSIYVSRDKVSLLFSISFRCSISCFSYLSSNKCSIVKLCTIMLFIDSFGGTQSKSIIKVQQIG